MAANLYWFYDAFIVGILLITLYCGAKRGLMRSVVLILLMVASVALSWIISTVAAPIIYENLIQDSVVRALNESSAKTDPVVLVSNAVSTGGYGVEMTDAEVEDVISQSGNIFANIASEIKSNGAGESASSIEIGVEESVTESMLKALIGDVVSPSTLREVLESVSGAENSLRHTVDIFLSDDPEATASAVENELIAPVIKLLLKGIIWVVAMMILTLLARTVSGAFQALNRIPIIGPVNSVLGAALGLAEGILTVYVVSQLVRLVCYLTSNTLMFLNVTTVDQTYLFKWLFYFDVISILG